MNVKECFEKRLLRKIAPDKLKAESSLRIAENKLQRAKELLEEDFFAEALVTAYTSMFHAARTLLYKDGIQEKSHYAVYIYLNEKYSGKINKGLIEFFLNYQLERHKALYGFDGNIKKEDADCSVEDAEMFLMGVKKIYE